MGGGMEGGEKKGGVKKGGGRRREERGEGGRQIGKRNGRCHYASVCLCHRLHGKLESVVQRRMSW